MPTTGQGTARIIPQTIFTRAKLWPSLTEQALALMPLPRVNSSTSAKLWPYTLTGLICLALALA